MMIAISAGLIFVSFWVLASRHLNLALATLLAISPAYLMRFKLGGILPSTWLEMAIIGIIIAVLSSLIFQKNFRTDFSKRWKTFYQEKKLLVFLCLLIFIASLSSIIIAPNILSALGLAKAYLWEPLIYLFLILMYWEKKDLKTAILLLIPTFIFLNILVFNQVINGYAFLEMAGNDANWRATGPYPYPNALGLFLAPASLLLLILIKDFFKNKKWWLAGALIFLLISNVILIFLAQSEAAILALFAGLALWILSRPKGMYLALIGGVLMLGAITYYQFWPKIINKISLQDFSGQIRRQMILETGDMLKDHFLLGAGLGAYQTAVEAYHWPVMIFRDEAGKLFEQTVEIYMYPHNLFFNFWTELGLLGLLAMSSLIILTFVDGWRAWWRNKDEYLLIISLSLIVLVIHGLVDVPIFKNDLALLFFFLIAASQLLHTKTIPATKA